MGGGYGRGVIPAPNCHSGTDLQRRKAVASATVTEPGYPLAKPMSGAFKHRRNSLLFRPPPRPPENAFTAFSPAAGGMASAGG